ncbi:MULTISPECIES: carbon-nitrogen hydrolase family protein [Kitasatospora]|uniref:carbon-nitrogen hydrolase family protein n=1 Tax=Kitasatospora TaxID=2063 RepID=UPI000C702EE6|nr:carbon-nitrogen hydrolase family protein [Kitasatospora sp. GP30]
MREPLTVAAVQPVWAGADVLANVREHAQAIEKADVRLVVFPEFSLTGYDLDAPSLPADDHRLRPLVDACRVAGSVALVGAPIRHEDGRDYIATLAVTGDGVTVAYRKMWLHGAEFDRFSPGDKPVVVTVDGWRLGLAICYDAAVPQHAADSAALGIDAYVASTLYGPGTDSAARRDAHMRERAAVHRIWVVLATAAGPSGSFAQTSGGSGIWGRNGELVAQAGCNAGEMTATLLS